MSYIERVKGVWPKVKVVRKSESKLMRLIGWFLRITSINKGFMDNYITTVHWTIYWPDSLPLDGFNGFRILTHELKHVDQYRRYGVLYDIAYLLWPLLSIFSLLSFLAFINLWHLLWLVCLFSWIPLPWTFRALFEAQAFGTEIGICRHYYGDMGAEKAVEYRAKNTFPSKDYYFMGTEEYARKKITSVYKNSLDFPLKNVALQYLEENYGRDRR